MQHLEAAHRPSPASTSENSPTVERRIGGLTAQLAGTIAYALWERENGTISPETKRHGGELIYELIRWKMLLPEFDALAREHGRRMLLERYGCMVETVTLSESTLDEMVEQALAALTKVVKAKCN
jgi:hypothetical protein